MRSQPSLKVHVFRIQEGLGNACLLQFPDDTCGIVDWGTRRKEPMEAALTIAGNRGFRFVAASHAHADHTAGLATILRECVKRKIDVGRFVYPASTVNKENAYLTKARVVAYDHDIPMFPIGVDMPRASTHAWQPRCLAEDEESWEVLVLSPAVTDSAAAEIRAMKKSEVPGNETSLVVLFRYTDEDSAAGLGRVLLPGDATPATLEFARQTAAGSDELSLDNQMFLVPHHGSRRNLPAWLSNHTKGIAVVSGRTNSLQHPSLVALQSLRQWTGKSAGIFCTSYARCCAKAFGKQAVGAEKALVKPGSCFGDIVIRIPPDQPAQFESSSDPGDRRRKFGYCQ